MSIREKVARAIYHAAFENHHGGKLPEPGWCWDKCGPVQQEFASKQATAAITAFLEAAAEEGWHMRPDEATDKMKRAASESRQERGSIAQGRYSAMCDAAPEYEVDG